MAGVAINFCLGLQSCNHHSWVSIFVLKKARLNLMAKCLQKLRKNYATAFGGWIIKNKFVV